MFIESFASKKGIPFNTQILNSTNPEHRNPRVKCCMGCLDKLLNTAIITCYNNADHLLAKNKRRAEDMPWAGVNKKRFDSAMFS